MAGGGAEEKQQLLALLQALQNAFLSLENTLPHLQQASKEISSILEGLCPLYSQLSACQSLSPEQVPLTREFPHVLERTLHLVTQDISDRISLANQKMQAMGERQAGVWQHSVKVEGILKHKCKAVSMATLRTGTATVPAAWDMVQWLHSAAQRLHEQRLHKAQLLQRLSDGTADCDEDFVTEWCQHDKEDTQAISDWLAHLQFFLEEDL